MRRYLVVANQTLGADLLYDKVRACLAEGPCAFHIVVPATPPSENLTWTEGEHGRSPASDWIGRSAGSPSSGRRWMARWGTPTRCLRSGTLFRGTSSTTSSCPRFRQASPDGSTWTCRAV